MHTGYADAMRIIPHEVAEQVRPINDGDAGPCRCGKLGIVHGNRSRINHRVGTFDVFRSVRINHGNSRRRKPLGDRRGRPVGPRDKISSFPADKGKA